ncbi:MULTISPECIES: hypothetical protein [Actinomadura]|uniref:Uncharacterized protein n=1 Tax=Actinomadura geliboluensis TaxID=882440 RepID=A0A5S4GJN1_9ACTN|nr:hypothetical protein [Actinomadura geliboluensis]TMR32714.1 hypothetical protein ETD96_28935 [Actinomadura geliboluensis]
MTLHEPEIASLLRLEAPDASRGADAAPPPFPGRPRVWTDLALIVCVIALALLGAIVIGVEMSRLAAAPAPCLAPR